MKKATNYTRTNFTRLPQKMTATPGFTHSATRLLSDNRHLKALAILSINRLSAKIGINLDRLRIEFLDDITQEGALGLWRIATANANSVRYPAPALLFYIQARRGAGRILKSLTSHPAEPLPQADAPELKTLDRHLEMIEVKSELLAEAYRISKLDGASKIASLVIDGYTAGEAAKIAGYHPATGYRLLSALRKEYAKK